MPICRIKRKAFAQTAFMPGPENRASIRRGSDKIYHMSMLANLRHELFAQAVASGKSATEAYRQRGANGKNADVQAAKLVVKSSIRERVAELKEAQSQKSELSAIKALSVLQGYPGCP
jgi:hypothetical protein